jgi:putative transposase
MIMVMVTEGPSIKTTCRVLQDTEAGFYTWRKRPPSEQAIRHAWLTDLITKVHIVSRGTNGARRVDAQLSIGPSHRRGTTRWRC